MIIQMAGNHISMVSRHFKLFIVKGWCIVAKIFFSPYNLKVHMINLRGYP